MNQTSPEAPTAEVDFLTRKVKLLQGNLDRITEIGCSIIYILDAQGKFTFVNKAVEDILHYKPEELIGMHFSCILSSEEFDRVGRDRVLPRFAGRATTPDLTPKLFDERRRGDRRTRNIEVQLLTKEGKEVKVLRGDVTGIMSSEGCFAPDAGPAGPTFIGSQGIIFDITELKRSEDQKKKLESKFSELQKFDAVGRLAGGAAHNFNNKLGAILGYAEMIRSRFSANNPDLQRYVELIIAATKQSAELTGQLLAFSRQGTYQKVSINLNTVILKVGQLFTGAMLQRIRIVRDLDARNPVTLGDPTQIQNAILNIAMNAVDAMPDGGDLSFETRIVSADEALLERHGMSGGSPSYVLINISDTGVGMTNEVKGRIFEPFFTTKEVGKGVGMGLASVYGCVKNHHGFIEVASQPAQGSCFGVYLPYAGEEGLAVRETAVAEGEPLRGTGKVLVAEDDADILSIVREMLVELGYQVVACRNGHEAVEYYRAHSSEVDCAIIDIIMPVCDGRQCFLKMREINPKVSVAVMTGYSANDEIDTLLAEGARDFLTKPFDIHRLSQVVFRAINY